VIEKIEVGMKPTTAADSMNAAAAPSSGAAFQQS
jgi:hypothetical protein